MYISVAILVQVGSGQLNYWFKPSVFWPNYPAMSKSDFVFLPPVRQEVRKAPSTLDDLGCRMQSMESPMALKRQASVSSDGSGESCTQMSLPSICGSVASISSDEREVRLCVRPSHYSIDLSLEDKEDLEYELLADELPFPTKPRHARSKRSSDSLRSKRVKGMAVEASVVSPSNEARNKAKGAFRCARFVHIHDGSHSM